MAGLQEEIKKLFPKTYMIREDIRTAFLNQAMPLLKQCKDDDAVNHRFQLMGEMEALLSIAVAIIQSAKETKHENYYDDEMEGT